MEKVYMIKPKALKEVKKALEADDELDGEEKKINEWKRRGYDLRDSESLGFQEEGSYLYVNAPEEFFEQNEEEIEHEGVKELEKNKKKEVIKAIKEEKESAAQGMGTIFD